MKKGKKLIALIVGVLMIVAMAITVVACGGGGDTPSGKTYTRNWSGPLVKVAIINNPATESGYRAANVGDMAKVFTKDNGYDATFTYNKDLEPQIAAFNKAVTDKVDYILLSAAEADGWDAAMDGAVAAGIPVYLFDRMIDDDRYEAALVSDMANQGIMAVDWLLKLKADGKLTSIKVLHLQGKLGSDAQLGRTGALEAAKAEGKLEIAFQEAPEWSEEVALSTVADIIVSGNAAAQPFNVIYAENDDMAKGAVAALDAAGIAHGFNADGTINGIVIMGFDCNKFALRELLAKKWNYDGQCSPFQAEFIDSLIMMKEYWGVDYAITDSTKKIINKETCFDGRTITQLDIDTYGLGD